MKEDKPVEEMRKGSWEMEGEPENGLLQVCFRKEGVVTTAEFLWKVK